VVETNTFGANFMVLGDYDLMDQVYESNRAGAHLAKKVAQTFTSSSKPCFVAGSIGPGTRLPSLGQITFSALEQGYQTQVRGLIDGGVDLLVIETCQDILQTKAALNAALAILHEKGQDLPIIIQITLEKGSGTMLVGTDISAALTVLAPYAIDAIGINCATGPADMREAVHFLSQFSPKLISVQPNAGMPENVQGTAVYPLQPDELAEAHRQFVENDGVNIIGGCCGTTTTHLEAVVKALKNRHCGNRSPHLAPAVASLYQSVPLAQTPRPLIIGERANANGSRALREALAGFGPSRDRKPDKEYTVDLVIVGGGISGCAAALAAAPDGGTPLVAGLGRIAPDRVQHALMIAERYRRGEQGELGEGHGIDIKGEVRVHHALGVARGA